VEIEIEKEKNAHHPKIQTKDPGKATEVCKSFCEKEIMEIRSKNAQSKETPPKKVVNKKANPIPYINRPTVD